MDHRLFCRRVLVSGQGRRLIRRHRLPSRVSRRGRPLAGEPGRTHALRGSRGPRLRQFADRIGAGAKAQRAILHGGLSPGLPGHSRSRARRRGFLARPLRPRHAADGRVGRYACRLGGEHRPLLPTPATALPVRYVARCTPAAFAHRVLRTSPRHDPRRCRRCSDRDRGHRQRGWHPGLGLDGRGSDRARRAVSKL